MKKVILVLALFLSGCIGPTGPEEACPFHGIEGWKDRISINGGSCRYRCKHGCTWWSGHKDADRGYENLPPESEDQP